MARLQFVLALALILVNLVAAEDSIITSTVVTFGIDTTPLQYPFTCILKTGINETICGSTIINENWLLTSAECATANPEDVSYICGKHVFDDTADNQQSGNAEALIPHIYYDDDDVVNNNIGLLKLPVPLVFDETVRPIKLAKPSHNVTDTDATIIGWGFASEAQYANLQYANVSLVAQDECEKLTYRYINDLTTDVGFLNDSICAGHVAGIKDDCKGHLRGAPMIVLENSENGSEYIQIGITSWVDRPCESPNAPMGYTKVAKFYHWVYGILAAYSDM